MKVVMRSPCPFHCLPVRLYSMVGPPGREVSTAPSPPSAAVHPPPLTSNHVKVSKAGCESGMRRVPLEKTLNSKMEQNEHYPSDSVLSLKLVFLFRVVILLDVSAANSTYIIHIQHSLRLLLEEQMSNKDAFNVIAYAPRSRSGRGAGVGATAEPLGRSLWREAGRQMFWAPSILAWLAVYLILMISFGALNN